MRGRTIMAWAGMGVALGASLSQGLFAAEPSPPLAPTSKWEMNYAPNECRLLRTFGEGKAQVLLQISRFDVRDSLEMALAGPRFPATERNVPVLVATSTVAEVPGIEAQGFEGTGGVPSTLRFRPDSDLPKALRSDVAAGKPTMLAINFVRRYAVKMDLGPMKGALDALDKCSDDLIRSWGLDPVQQRLLKSGPMPATNPADWFRPSDYPAGPANMGMGGAVIIRLLIGADGSVRDCAVTKSGGDKAFQDATCHAATERAKFRPAIDAEGKPVTSVWLKRINWKPGAPFFVFRG
ncbi:energy transducer TonB [Sphingomonas sp.]|uniref:energy transducer TonB n=1 Tax=Sphingomonas sp. TaxID=28214 RepID=UPI0031D9D434